MIAENIKKLHKNINRALTARISCNVTQQVKIIGVTKNQTVAKMQQAVDAGIFAIGENRVQEATEKFPRLDRPVEWHMIGHLQTNKVKQSVKMFQLIHSVDSENLAFQINKAAANLGKIQDVLIQVNIADEQTKFGVAEQEVMPLARYIAEQSNLRLCGLMTIAPHFDNAEHTRPIFQAAYLQFIKLRETSLPNTCIQWLSMGMSNDYEIAIQEGSNLIRIGTDIFGEREY